MDQIVSCEEFKDMAGLDFLGGKPGDGLDILIPFVDLEITVEKIEQSGKIVDEELKKLILGVQGLNLPFQIKRFFL